MECVMGGNAIKDAKRIDKVEYDKIISELYEFLPNIRFEPVKAYFSKTDFGDIDLVTEKHPTRNLKDEIRAILPIEDEYDNGPFFSVSYKSVQVDFIFMSKEEFDTALNYFHWNDLGNFLGRTARSLNFKYGHDGLSYDKHYSDHYKVSIHVSSDIRKILEFLGYDYETWAKGFFTKEDIFDYAMNSPYFNATYFALEEQAHNDRVRNKKRKMYQGFLQYIHDKGILGKPKLSQEERQVHYERAIDIFGNEFDLKVKEAQENYNRNLIFKEYFNGDLISDYTGLTGKDLGIFMQKLKSSTTNFQESVIAGGHEYVKKLVKNKLEKI